MKISILLPYKENFSSYKAGAVSLYVKDISIKSKFKNNILIYGDTIENNKLLNNFKHLSTKGKFYLSKTKAYIEEFLKNEKKNNSEIIEIHNRPSYINLIYKNSKAKIILYFHNDPLSMKGSTTIDERKDLLSKCNKIVFNSEWCKLQFTKDLDIIDYLNKITVINQSTSKTKINFKKKKNIISFVGKLNSSKGYDIFGKAIIRILNEFHDWTSIVIGDEPRQKFFFNHKRLKIYGFKDNNFILNKLKLVSISVVPSIWQEPFGRSSLEASSRGCALIISNTGGLKETTKDALVIENINVNNLYKSIKKLIKNKKLRIELQKNTHKNFFLTNEFITKEIDSLRNSVINKKNYSSIKIKNCLKILHITNLNERFDGRLHYNTGKRLNNGFIRLNHNVLTLSDRDIIRKGKKLSDLSGIHTLNSKILNTHKNFKADLIVLGHADNITKDTIINLKKINDVKICQWFLDPLIAKGPDYKKNKSRIRNLSDFIDSTFLTTHPTALDFKITNSYFIPNPCDSSFEILNNSLEEPSSDLFFAMSHGVHRGVLKGGKYDEREFFLKKLKNKISNISFDIFGMNGVQPIWGDFFLQILKNYKMGLNLSRGKPVKYYSSDRIVQLIGNGLLTFIDKKTYLYEIIDSNEAIFYNDMNDLINKINYYKKNTKLLKTIANNGRIGYFKKFNSNIVCQYIIDKTLDKKSLLRYSWK